jgi:hypothetical protein
MGAFFGILIKENEMKGLGVGWPRKFSDIFVLPDLVSRKTSLQKLNEITKNVIMLSAVYLLLC